MRRQRCVCRRSSTFPFCDGSHTAEHWSCADVSVSHVRLAFCSTSETYYNLALKLGSVFEHQRAGNAAVIGTDLLHALVQDSDAHTCEWLVLLVTGDSIELAIDVTRRVRSAKLAVVGLGGAPAEALAARLGAPQAVDLAEVVDDVLVLSRQAQRVVEGLLKGGLDEMVEEGVVRVVQSGHGAAEASAFLSHAVRDEAVLQPVVEAVRMHYGGDLFVCSDSIATGSDWREEIVTALRDKEFFLYVLSEASKQSHFCSFEVGMAAGLRKCVKIISLDGTLPPAFVGHLHMVDVPRVLRQKPWLTVQDVLLEEILGMLARPELHRCHVLDDEEDDEVAEVAVADGIQGWKVAVLVVLVALVFVVYEPMLARWTSVFLS